MATFSKIALTSKARSKEFRLFSRHQMREKIKGRDGTIYRKGGSNEYHLVSDPYVLVVVTNGDTLTVVTQMHEHVNYPEDDLYTEVGEFGQ